MSSDLVSNENDQARAQPERIGGEALFKALQAGSLVLQAHVADVNALNVFPVPDGDTGTNMSLTLRAALDEVSDPAHLSASEVFHQISHGALMGARGNSGVILSQILRGFARKLDDKAEITVDDIAAALQESAETAYKGVMKPVEGTMLTVIREAADMAARAAQEGADIETLLTRTLNEARASLARTPDLLPVLADAGVVDAGGQGLVRILEGILNYVRGDSVVAEPDAQGAAGAFAHEIHDHPPDEAYGFDIQFILEGENLDVEGLREQLVDMGDSLLAVGDEKAVKVHIHSDHPGDILEFGIRQGTISSIIVENMQLQYEEFIKANQPPPAVVQPSDRVAASLASTEPLSDIGIVAVASGEGLADVLKSLGVNVVVPGGQTMNPSTQELIEAIESLSHNSIVVLPNNSNIILTAEQARDISSKDVRVVPTKTVPQGIAALLAFNYQAELEENYEAMVAMSQQVETIEVTRAVRSVQVNGLAVSEGQFIGLLNGNLKTVSDELFPVIKALFERIPMDEYEIITIYYGADVTGDDAQALLQELETIYPDLEFEVLSGGQAHYYYIISVE